MEQTITERIEQLEREREELVETGNRSHYFGYHKITRECRARLSEIDRELKQLQGESK